jgi:polyisoprenyl-teichoic acid--peptidoglycan teichoic acid transferase
MAEDVGEVTDQGTPKRRKRRRLVIALIALGVVFVVVAGLIGGSYWAFSLKVHAANTRIDPAVQQALDTPPPSSAAPPGGSSVEPAAEPPLNILLLGNDAREGVVGGPGSSDLIMILHIDRERDFLSIMSVTRDLWVDVPGHGMDRINDAFTWGGPALTISTLKHVLGVDITKYVGVGYEMFPSIIDSLGGVYIDVDRRYTDTPYWAIDLSPGYQLLNGSDALLYSRYRFDAYGNPGRMARQQRVLAAVRDQTGGWTLPFKLPGVVDTVLSSTATNLTSGELLTLGRWLVSLDGQRIKQITVWAAPQMIDGKMVVVMDQAALAEAVTDMLTPPGEDTAAASEDPAASPVLMAASDDALRLALTVQSSATVPDLEMWKSVQATVPFALEAPTYLPDGFAYGYKRPEGSGTYPIKVGDGTKPAVRMVYRYQGGDLCLGVTATTWTDAPIARQGTEVEHDGTTYTVVGTSDNTDHVWWKKDGVLYFVSNTLMYSVSRDDLLRVAESMTPVGEPAATQ